MIKNFRIDPKIVLSFICIVLTQGIYAEDFSKLDKDDELTRSFQREYAYLVSQKSALMEQKSKLEKQLNKKIALTQQQINQAQKEIVALGSENDEAHEYFLSLDRRKKELQKKEFSLESVFKKATKSISEFKAGLYFETAPKKINDVTPSELKIADFERLLSEAKESLLASTQVEDFPSSFLNAEEKLVDGTITRFGRSAAIGLIKDQYFALGPDGKGSLKALESIAKPSSASMNLYIFDSINKVAEIKKHGGLTEKLADLSPILFLGMMLLMVLGLFVAMIRV